MSASSRSFRRYATDVFLYRALQLGDLPRMNRERRILLRDGLMVNYRLNRGDVQSIREVWVDEVYRLPFDLTPQVVIDLGANIGLTSLFFASRYGCSTVIAVEPLASNARLARANLLQNRVPGEVIQAAVGPKDGMARFQGSRDSNLGRMSVTGEEVLVVSMPTLLASTPNGRVDLVKIDIEGDEEKLLAGDLRWLDHVGSMIIEFHPAVVDYPALVGVLKKSGFRYLPAGSVWRGSMDCFVRDGWPSPNAEQSLSPRLARERRNPGGDMAG